MQDRLAAAVGSSVRRSKRHRSGRRQRHHESESNSNEFSSSDERSRSPISDRRKRSRRHRTRRDQERRAISPDGQSPTSDLADHDCRVHSDGDISMGGSAETPHRSSLARAAPSSAVLSHTSTGSYIPSIDIYVCRKGNPTIIGETLQFLQNECHFRPEYKTICPLDPNGSPMRPVSSLHRLQFVLLKATGAVQVFKIRPEISLDPFESSLPRMDPSAPRSDDSLPRSNSNTGRRGEDSLSLPPCSDRRASMPAGKEFSVAEPKLLSDEQLPHATVEESTREVPNEPAFHPHPQTPVLEITTVPKAGPVVPLDRVELTPPTVNPARTDSIVSFLGSEPDHKSDKDIASIIDDLDGEKKILIFNDTLRCDNFDPEVWSIACYTYRIPPEVGKDAAARIPIPGIRFRRRPYLYQVYGTVWILYRKGDNLQNRSFLADDIGFGKTLVTYLVILTARWIEIALQRARDQPSSQPDYQACGHDHDLPIRYPCRPSAKNHVLFQVRKGANYIFVDASLIATWCNEWKLIVDTRDAHIHDMIFVLRYRDSYRNLLYKTIVSRYRLGTMSLEDREAWRQIREDPKRDHCSRFILLTTPQSYDSRFANFVSRTRRLPPDPTRKAPVWKTSHRITVGRTFRDECHTTYGETTPIVLKLMALAECWALAHWFLSATPCTSSPANLAAFMRLTETRQWRANPCTRKNNYQLLQQLGKQFNTVSAKENVTQIDAILDRLGTFFRAINFLKRTQESVWFGRTCLDFPEQIVHPIDCPLDATDRENIKQLRDTRLGDIYSAMHTVNRGALKVKLSSMTQAIRICAAFPGLLCHAKQQGKAITDIPTTVERMEAEDILPHPENSWLASQIDTVLRGSSRWVAIQQIIDGLGIESDTGQPRKIVILSQYPTVAVIVYLAICKYYPAHHPYLGLRNAADRSFWVDKFQE
ncbi:uncharacterized protein KD926_006030, partial [Aspergillus affinis]|uniref:uncharacterized protein n=1 Tax=Aspergillus affinis TaxID=1070780 RepID=UPI0022FEEB4A